jgi:PKD repeat protein
MNRVLTGFVVLLALLVLAGSVSSESLPVFFYGSVTIDGKPAPPGTVVSAKNNVNDCGMYITRNTGSYGQFPGTGIPPFVVSCPSIQNKDRISFYINGVKAKESYNYQPDNVVNLSLSAGQQKAPDIVFTASVREGLAPLQVQFTDTSQFPATSWSWDFGDGTDASFAANPTHVYTRPGIYDVRHTGANRSVSGSSVKLRYITVYPRWDFNHDWKIDADDMAALQKAIQGGVQTSPDTDLNHDGIVNESDVCTISSYLDGKK